MKPVRGILAHRLKTPAPMSLNLVTGCETRVSEAVSLAPDSLAPDRAKPYRTSQTGE